MNLRGSRFRAATFAGVAVIAVAGSTGYVWLQAQEAGAAREPTVATAADRGLDLLEVRARPHLAFRSTALGPTYGKLAAVPLEAPAGPRAASGLDCERVDATRFAAVCLTVDRGVTATTTLRVLDAELQPVRDVAVHGLPSRTRMSDDGGLASTTTFVTGHSYAGGAFSTQTVVHDLHGQSDDGDLETWHVEVDGERSTAVDLNVWGVTFSPDDPSTVWATVATGGRTWLAEGNLEERTLRTVHPDVECPSVSPDGARIAFKQAAEIDGARGWRVAVLDLADGRVTTLAETRTVDDQPEWLDDERILYGLPRADSAETDVWMVPADGSGVPEVLVPRAWSPAVVR